MTASTDVEKAKVIEEIADMIEGIDDIGLCAENIYTVAEHHFQPIQPPAGADEVERLKDELEEIIKHVRKHRREKSGGEPISREIAVAIAAALRSGTGDTVEKVLGDAITAGEIDMVHVNLETLMERMGKVTQPATPVGAGGAFIDENGTTWHSPTPEAYAVVCKALEKAKLQNLPRAPKPAVTVEELTIVRNCLESINDAACANIGLPRKALRGWCNLALDKLKALESRLAQGGGE